MTAKGLAGKCVLLSSFSSIPAMAKALFPFIPVPALLVKDPFDNARLAPSVNVPVLCLHGTRDEIVPFAQGRAICDLLPSSEFVALPNCGHNDTFNGAAYRLIVDSLAALGAVVGVGASELAGASAEELEEIFEEVDADGDGCITEAEFVTSIGMLKRNLLEVHTLEASFTRFRQANPKRHGARVVSPRAAGVFVGWRGL